MEIGQQNIDRTKAIARRDEDRCLTVERLDGAVFGRSTLQQAQRRGADGYDAPASGARGVGINRVTLHVGAGTFLPVKAADTEAHQMHSEWGSISSSTAATLNAARKNGGRIIAVGTTSLRLLESAAAEDGSIVPFERETAIFITPGYRFRAVDILLTNFHLPRSTLFMLVSAFSGLDTMKRAYAHAITDGYRFYSDGDACLLFRARD